MRTSAVLALALVLSASYFGYRITRLEQRIDALNKQLGAPPATPPLDAAHDEKPLAGHEQRLTALEQGLHALRDDLRTLEEATADKPQVADLSAPGASQKILSLVAGEQNRIRDRQLQFHRERWVEWRQAALKEFAERQGLTPAQSEQLRQLLTDEVDKMVDILRRPDALENPDQATKDWAATLEETDNSAHRVLEPAQRGPWDDSRTLERRVLWPWLPAKKAP